MEGLFSTGPTQSSFKVGLEGGTIRGSNISIYVADGF